MRRLFTAASILLAISVVPASATSDHTRIKRLESKVAALQRTVNALIDVVSAQADLIKQDPYQAGCFVGVLGVDTPMILGAPPYLLAYDPTTAAGAQPSFWLLAIDPTCVTPPAAKTRHAFRPL